MGLCKALENLGASVCDNPISVASRLIFVPLVGSTGEKNGFDNAAAVIKTAIEANLNAANKQDRFYPLPTLEDVESVRGDATFHEFKSGSKKFVKTGVKNFVGYLPQQHAQFLEKLKGWQGQRFGVFIIDNKGNFIYMTDSETKLKVYPFPVDGNSFLADFIDPSDEKVNMVKISFDYKVAAKDELMRFIAASSLDFNALDEDEIYSLWDVTGTVSGESTSGFDIALETSFGVPVTGLETSDFTVTDSAGDPVTVSGVTEDNGTYTVECTGLSGGETLTVTISKDRYDFSAVTALEVSIPT